MALTEVTCWYCCGRKVYMPADGWVEITCEVCWGAGVIERQYGPQDPDDQVPDSANLARDRAVFARWEQEREREG